MISELKNMDSISSDARLGTRIYTAPKLIVYGRVAALTRSATGCTDGDNLGCTAGIATNMGYKPNVSDKNAKENIVRRGDHPLGIGLYLFDYKAEYRQQWGQCRQFGVMAQEVEAVIPEAIYVHPDGYKMVNYAMLGITQTVH